MQRNAIIELKNEKAMRWVTKFLALDGINLVKGERLHGDSRPQDQAINIDEPTLSRLSEEGDYKLKDLNIANGETT